MKSKDEQLLLSFWTLLHQEDLTIPNLISCNSIMCELHSYQKDVSSSIGLPTNVCLRMAAVKKEEETFANDLIGKLLSIIPIVDYVACDSSRNEKGFNIPPQKKLHFSYSKDTRTVSFLRVFINTVLQTVYAYITFPILLV